MSFVQPGGVLSLCATDYDYWKKELLVMTTATAERIYFFLLLLLVRSLIRSTIHPMSTQSILHNIVAGKLCLLQFRQYGRSSAVLDPCCCSSSSVADGWIGVRIPIFFRFPWWEIVSLTIIFQRFAPADKNTNLGHHFRKRRSYCSLLRNLARLPIPQSTEGLIFLSFHRFFYSRIGFVGKYLFSPCKIIPIYNLISCPVKFPFSG